VSLNGSGIIPAAASGEAGGGRQRAHCAKMCATRLTAAAFPQVAVFWEAKMNRFWHKPAKI